MLSIRSSVCRFVTATLLLAGFAFAAQAQQSTSGTTPTPRPPYEVPDDVSMRKVDIYSEGARLTGYTFVLKATPADKKLPTIIMGHGWGGRQVTLRQDATEFAKEGYFVLTIDYRGWGESDARVMLTQPAPTGNPTKFSAEVRALREIVDPLDMAADWQNAIHWVMGEPQVDVNRVGIWGSSMGGSLVVYAGAHDARVKAVHSQVTGGLVSSLWTQAATTFTDATKRARGEIGYPEPGVRMASGLLGVPITSRFANYNPLEDINDVTKTAFQFVLSENEQYLNNEEHAIAAYKRYKGPKNLVVIPGIAHYDIYNKAREQAHTLAREWFDKYLKNAK